ncbi:MAG: glycosyltransferase family 39 protein [Burkholderiales bacterium]|nr:glycosyltransferase family 39 protein [Burkholderiales bacterium]
MTLNARSALFPLLAATFALKLLLAAFVPFSGDEAYFLIWGRHLDFGFYDHPPMVGWLLWLMLRVSEAEWVLRLPVVLFTSFVGYGLYRLLRAWDEEKAALIALIYLLSPMNWLGFIITTDAGLIFFSFLTVWLLARGLQSGKTQHFVWAGVAFGLACLSKYFAALLGLALIAYWVATPKARAQSRNFMWLFLAALPFIALNVYWNYGHGWANVMFNVFNRHENAGVALYKPLLYGLLHLYLMTPLAVWWLIKQRAGLGEVFRDERFRLLAFVVALPMAVFALLSIVKVIGLHWLLSFYPFVFALLAYWLSRDQLVHLLRFMRYYAGAHLVLFAVILFMPMAAWQATPYARGAVLMFKTTELLEQVEPYSHRYVLASDGYSMAAILSYAARTNVLVFGEASSHARHDDIVTDFRELNGKNILVLLKQPPVFERYGPYFKSIEFSEMTLHDAKFYLVLGQGFDYASYREKVLRRVKEKYYAVPTFLPMKSCYFAERYFPNETCRPQSKP